MFKIKIKNFSKRKLPELIMELIGSFSIDGDLQYHADLSQLKYYIPPSDPNNANYDLGYNVTSICHKPDLYTKLDDILKWISDNFNQLEKPLSPNEGHWLSVDFVCNRGALKKLFSSPYKKDDGWIICASKYRDTIYLCEYYTDKRASNVSFNIKNKVYSHGLKFIQYMVADHPAHKPNLSVPFNECKKFRCVFKTKFGDHSLLYTGKIDSISSEQPMEDTLIGKKFKIIEMKTLSLYNKNGNLYGKLNPDRVVDWWSQNYLTGIDTTICGLKVKNAVRMIKEYPTHILPQFSKIDCNVDKCKMFCEIFLNHVKRIVIKDHDECMYKFQWDSSTKDIVRYSEESPNNEMYTFLKPWFISKTEKHKFPINVRN
ncbi:decapping and exoribonuclease protein-like [Odontomachus brunneus]|uniref:decapping and exoribonuclease protein-like n=1 Tax=Odontomachus brunneus TaxID=486640 RepID=UPI0013F2A72F|nr:decapping and exoribonuclease protein-like [Odontomachus brunneus]